MNNSTERARLYARKSAVILPEERSYMEEERGYIPGRALLCFCNENSGHLRFCLQPRAAHALRSDQLMASLAPARAEVEAGVVARADQQ